MARRMIHMPADTDLHQLYIVWSDAERLLLKHGLKDKDWKVVFDNTKRRGGQCRYAEREIGLSAHLMAVWDYEHCWNTIIHEVAHALTPGHGHDKVWRAKHIELGGNGKRLWGSDGEKKLGKYIGTCPNGHVHTRQRKSKEMNPGIRVSCGSCSSRYDARYMITWKENK